MRRFKTFISCILAAVLCGSCTTDQKGSTVSFKYLTEFPIEGQQSYDRILGEVSLRKLFKLPKLPGEVPIAPEGVFADTMGYIYVGDEWDYRLHRFDSTGNYITSYGEGQGVGPGELSGLLDFGMIDDSLVYILETITRELSYFSLDGSFRRSERLDNLEPKYQHKITPSGREYSMFMLQGNTERTLFETRLGSDVVKFGQLYGARPYNWGMVAGNLVTFKEQIIYVAQRYPLFIQYSPDGSMKYARTTMDYVSIEEPKVVESTRNGMSVSRLDGPSLVMDFPTVYRGQLFIHAYLAQTVDIYDAETGDYQHSIKLPENGFAHVLNDRIYQAGDSTVSVWAIEKNGLQLSASSE